MKSNKILIVGGGSAGWMTAATLIKAFPDRDITVLESPNYPTVGVGESTIGKVKQWTKFLDIDDKEFLKHHLNLSNINKLILNSQIEAKDFYKKFGFVEVGKEFVEANIRHQKMIYKAKMVPAHGLEPRT